MERKKIELIVESVTVVEHANSMMAMALRELGGFRKLVIMIGAPEGNSILLRLNQQIVPRPLTPDLMEGSWRIFGINLEEVLINRAKQGVYYVSLQLNLAGIVKLIDARPSDAISMALRFYAPIYVYEDVLQAMQYIPNPQVALAEESPPQFMLKAQLERAIAEEDYELAARLRDKINSTSMNNQNRIR